MRRSRGCGKKKARPDTTPLDDDDSQLFAISLTQDSDHTEHILHVDAVARVLALLKEKHRTVLVLKFLEGKSYEEISDILRVPQGTVGTLIHRAKKEFIHIYEEHHE